MLHPIGALHGIGGARQAREYEVTIKDVDPTEQLEVGIDGSDQGQLGATAERSAAAAIKSRSERTLFSLASGH